MEKHPNNLNKFQEAYAYIFTVTNGADGFITRMNIMRELVELHTPKIVTDAKQHWHYGDDYVLLGSCPTCDGLVSDCDDTYCPHCGQKLDWTTKKEEV